MPNLVRHCLDWLLRRDAASGRYWQGLAHAHTHDHRAALDDYTAVIEMEEASAELRAMALYNRSVVHTAMNNVADAALDLRRLLEMSGAAANVKLEARRKLVRMQRTLDRSEGQGEATLGT